MTGVARDPRDMKETYADKTDLSSADQRVAAQSEEDSLSLDERFEILKNERRRLVLRLLKESDEPMKLTDLADEVTAIENETNVDAITSEQRKRVYVGLYQFHLPKMEKMDVIEYDQDRGDIALDKAGKQLYQEYSSDGNHEWTGQRAYLAVALVGVGSLIGSLLVQTWFVSTGLLAIQTLSLFVVLWIGYSASGDRIR